MGFRGKLWGILTLILGIAMLSVTAYQVPHWAGFMPDTFTKTLFWIGYIGQVVIAIGIKPYMIILRDEEGSPFGVAQGVVAFIAGIFLTLILYYLFDVFFGISGVFTGSMALQGNLTGIMWFGYILFTVLAMVIAPAFVSFTEPIDVNEMMGD